MAQELRLDYSVECEECGTVEDVPAGFSAAKSQQALRDQGWRPIDDENRCPACVRSVTTANAMLAQPNPPPMD